MPKLPVTTGKKLVHILVKIDFEEIRRSGSHVFLKHKDGRRTVVPIHGNKNIPKGTLLAILRDIKISKDDFLKMI
jgi:predicted RNA binding protein YcfA (HicA-like mRNA interferase family)